MTIKLDTEILQELAFVLGHMARFHLSGRSKGICQDLYNKISKEDLGENAALRNIKKRNSVITMKCTNCGCLLFNSLFPHPQGQFNLLNAGFCPSCGKRLI